MLLVLTHHDVLIVLPHNFPLFVSEKYTREITLRHMLTCSPAGVGLTQITKGNSIYIYIYYQYVNSGVCTVKKFSASRVLSPHGESF
jgi:hypothetical protein